MVIIVGNGYGDPSSNPGQDTLRLIYLKENLYHIVGKKYNSNIVVMLTKERHGEHKRVDRKNIYIQVTETRYKWTWLNSS